MPTRDLVADAERFRSTPTGPASWATSDLTPATSSPQLFDQTATAYTVCRVVWRFVGQT